VNRTEQAIDRLWGDVSDGEFTNAVEFDEDHTLNVCDYRGSADCWEAVTELWSADE